MFTSIINAINGTITGLAEENQSLYFKEKILRWIGIALLASFIFPSINFEAQLQFAFEPELHKRAMQSYSPVLSYTLFYLPLVFGIILLIAPLYLKKKTLNILLFCMALFALIVLPAALFETGLNYYEITSNSLFGTVWLFIISNALILTGISITGEEDNIIKPRYLIIAGSILFILNLLIPAPFYLWDYSMFTYMSSKMFVAVPFELFSSEHAITGLVLIVYLLLMLAFIIWELFLRKDVIQRGRDTGLKLFAVLLIFYFAGILISANIDILIYYIGYSRYPGKVNVRESFHFIKAALLIIPVIALTGISLINIINFIRMKRELP